MTSVNEPLVFTTYSHLKRLLLARLHVQFHCAFYHSVFRKRRLRSLMRF
jgi:hypothetical protein